MSITITGYAYELHSRELNESILDSPKAQGIPTGKRSTGPEEGEKREGETEPTETRQEEQPDKDTPRASRRLG